MVDDVNILRRGLTEIPGDPRAVPQATRRGVPQAVITPELASRPASAQPVDVGASAPNYRFPQFGFDFTRRETDDTPATTDAGTRGVAALRNIRAGENRGEFGGPGRGTFDPNDPFGVESGKQISAALGILENIPGISTFATPAKQFVDTFTGVAQGRQDAFTEGLVSGDAPVASDQGITMARRSSRSVDPDSGIAEGEMSVGDLKGGEVDQSSGASIGRRGDAGTGGGGDAGSGGGGGPSGAGGCFVAGTEITMADRSVKPIEKVDVGDLVLAYGWAGELQPRRVVTLFKHAPKPVIRINGDFVVTPEHRFWSCPAWLAEKGGAWSFLPIGELQRGDKIMTMNAEAVDIDSIEPVPQEAETYNFEVEELHTYIAAGYRVHNSKDAGGMIHHGPRLNMPRAYDSGGMIGGKSLGGDSSNHGYADRSPAYTTPYDAGGAVRGGGGVAPAPGGGTGGDMAPAMPPMDAGGMPATRGGLAPPGNGRVHIPAQEGEFVMTRAATEMVGPQRLGAVNDQARQVMGSDDMMGNVYPKTGAEQYSAPYATTQDVGPGPHPMYKPMAMHPEQMNVLVQRLDPDLASALMPLLSPKGQSIIREAIGHMGIAPAAAPPAQAPGMMPAGGAAATSPAAPPPAPMATPPAPTGAPGLEALRGMRA